MGVHRIDVAATVIRSRRGDMERAVNRVARQAMTGASRFLTAETPVKTGAARSNWVATNAQPFEGVIPAYAPFPDLDHGAAPPARKFESGNRSAARAQNQYAFGLFDYIRHGSMFLRNNVPHIGLLNDQWSQQSRGNFLPRALVAAIQAMRGEWRLNP